MTAHKGLFIKASVSHLCVFILTFVFLSFHIVRIVIAEDQISDQKDGAGCGVLLECNREDTKSSDKHSDIYLIGT